MAETITIMPLTQHGSLAKKPSHDASTPSRIAYILGQHKSNNHYHALEVISFTGGAMINGISPTLQRHTVIGTLTGELLTTVAERIIPRTIDEGNAWVRRAETNDRKTELSEFTLRVAYVYNPQSDQFVRMNPADFLSGASFPSGGR